MHCARHPARRSRSTEGMTDPEGTGRETGSSERSRAAGALPHPAGTLESRPVRSLTEGWSSGRPPPVSATVTLAVRFRPAPGRAAAHAPRIGAGRGQAAAQSTQRTESGRASSRAPGMLWPQTAHTP
jgi:hypothetical protein